MKALRKSRNISRDVCHQFDRLNDIVWLVQYALIGHTKPYNDMAYDRLTALCDEFDINREEVLDLEARLSVAVSAILGARIIPKLPIMGGMEAVQKVQDSGKCS